eukprot:jgi/Psemu1/301826/fgenesh1_kg.48_\
MFDESKKLPSEPPQRVGDEHYKYNNAGGNITPRTKSLSSSSATSEKHVDPKPDVPPASSQFTQQKDPPGITRNGSEVRGIIAPSRHQKQMMRQVSGLGLEDPVFGGRDFYDTSIKGEHASFFLEDMGIDDLPEDMRDMISLASDRTDEVNLGNSQQSLGRLEKIPITDGHIPSSIRRGSACTIAPLGLDASAAVASLQKDGKVPRNFSLHDSSHKTNGSSLSDESSFRIPKPNAMSKRERRTSSTSIALQDSALAAQVDAMLFTNEAKPSPMTKRERRTSNASMALQDQILAAQVDAMLFMNDSSNSHGSSSHGLTMKGAQQSNKPQRQGRRVSSCSANYAPPPPPTARDKPIQEGKRSLPKSMQDIFSSK